jgi:hypothetical protein
MCDVRKSVVRAVLMGLAIVMLTGTFAPAKAQTNKRKQEAHARRETNATRLARVQRSTEETYAHRYELIGGGGFLRFRSGDYTKKNNEVTWATALNYYLNPKLAIVADARGSFGNAHQQQPLIYPQIPTPQINEYTFMGGASYRFYAKEKVAYSVQGLAGTGWGLFSGGGKGLTGPELGLWSDGLRPAFSVGVSADYNVYPNLAVRVTPTYVGTNFVGANGSSIQNNVGVNVGVIYRFGHQ